LLRGAFGKQYEGLREKGMGIVIGYSIVRADAVEDSYAGTDVPGEFRSIKEALGAEQIAVTLIRVPPHSDFEQGTGHFHEELEERSRTSGNSRRAPLRKAIPPTDAT
jgi:hypothetical protein